MDYIGNKLDQGPMVGVAFRASGPPIFRCLFCGISWPMLCCYWFRWVNLHNGRHQRGLHILQQSGEDTDEIFTAMMALVL